MFAVLGDRQSQEEIRVANPKQNHCFLLKLSPTACAELPKSFGDLEAGTVCPHNPYHKNAQRLLRLENCDRLIRMALELHRSMAVGALDKDSPMIEITLAYTFGRQMEERNQWPKF